MKDSRQKLGARRLLKLSKYLQNVVARKYPRQFNMSLWSSGTFKDKRDPGCGTVACALGWATNIFPQLQLNYNEVSLKSRSKNGPSYRTGTIAAQRFFHITEGQACALFMPHTGHMIIRTVARNIARFARARL